LQWEKLFLDNNLSNDEENYPDIQIIFEQPQISITVDSEDNLTKTLSNITTQII